MTALDVLADIRIAAPCGEDWDRMIGDETVRFCLSCRKNVYSLDGMTRDEIKGLIEATEGKFCARLYKREDGTVLTADCPVGLAARAKQAARRAMAASIFLIVTLVTGVLAFLFGQAPRCDARAVADTITDTVIPPVDDGPRMMGAPVMGEPAMPTPPPPREKLMGKVALPVHAE